MPLAQSPVCNEGQGDAGDKQQNIRTAVMNIYHMIEKVQSNLLQHSEITFSRLVLQILQGPIYITIQVGHIMYINSYRAQSTLSGQTC